jgi:hypothetical protein
MVRLLLDYSTPLLVTRMRVQFLYLHLSLPSFHGSFSDFLYFSLASETALQVSYLQTVSSCYKFNAGVSGEFYSAVDKLVVTPLTQAPTPSSLLFPTLPVTQEPNLALA